MLWGWALHLTAQRLADSKRTELGTHSLRGCVEVPIYVPLPLWFIRRAAFEQCFDAKLPGRASRRSAKFSKQPMCIANPPVRIFWH